MACGCENTREIFPECDKTRWEVQCSSYIEDASNYYTKKQVDDLIESATTSGSCCITPEEVDEKIESAKTEIEAEIPSLSGYATEQWVEDKHYITGVDLSDYALKSEIPTSNTAFTNDAGYLTEHQSLSAYSTTDEVNSAITQAVSGKQDTLSAGTNITIVDNVISATGGGGEGKPIEGGRGITVTTGITADTVAFNLPISGGSGEGSIIENWTGNTAWGNGSHAEGIYTLTNGQASHAEGIYTTANGEASHAEGQYTDASGIASHAEGYYATAKGQASHAEGYYTRANHQGEHASGRYNKSNTGSTDADKTLFSVGNGTSNNARHNAFEIRQNGDIYITSGGTDIKLQDHIGGGSGVTSGEVQTMINEATSGLQQTLTAGTNVQINNNIISATDTTYTAGDNISISNQNVISTITKFWCGTQAQYDQITTKDPNTVYMIHS